jgi:hypothetical protein
MDYDITNYSTEELLEILDLPKKPKDSQIQTAVDGLVDKHKSNTDLVQFIQEAGRLLQATFEEDSTPVFETNVRRGSINPDMKNTVSRMVNLDSSYRELIDTDNAHTDSFTCVLSEPLNNVLSITLYSIELPMSWYNFSEAKGNTNFTVTLTYHYTIDASSKVSDVVYTGKALIPDGNYTAAELVAKTIEVMNTTVLTCPTASPSTITLATTANSGMYKVDASLNPLNGKYTWSVPGYDDGSNECYILDITWYDPTTGQCPTTTTINNNLGWCLGFRNDKTIFFNLHDASNTVVDKTRWQITTPALPNVYGTKYIIVRLNDYRSNRINKSLVGIRTFRDKYIPPLTSPETLSQLTAWSTQTNAKGPRRLTMHQMFAANAIQTNNIPTPRIRNSTIQDESDILVKIPVKRTMSDWTSDPGKLYVEFSGSLQTPVREYFGPCNIGTFNLSLCDDKGNLLGLNGLDWSCTLLVTHLYSY